MARGGWGYKVDYDAAVSRDESEIARLCSDAMVKMAAIVDANPSLWNMAPLRAVEVMPSLKEAFGLSDAELRGWIASMDVIDGRGAEWQDELFERFGSEQPGDVDAWRACSFSPDFRLFGNADYVDGRGQVRLGRLAMLKKAKADLARHKRNKTKYG